MQNRCSEYACEALGSPLNAMEIAARCHGQVGCGNPAAPGRAMCAMCSEVLDLAPPASTADVWEWLRSMVRNAPLDWVPAGQLVRAAELEPSCVERVRREFERRERQPLTPVGA
jgi:hypothetical protein